MSEYLEEWLMSDFWMYDFFRELHQTEKAILELTEIYKVKEPPEMLSAGGSFIL